MVTDFQRNFCGRTVDVCNQRKKEARPRKIGHLTALITVYNNIFNRFYYLFTYNFVSAFGRRFTIEIVEQLFLRFAYTVVTAQLFVMCC